MASSGRGGARKGAGRKPGGANKLTREIADRMAAGQMLSPLQVMLEAMGDAHSQGDYEASTKYANMAAPYCHPRLASIDQTSSSNISVTLKTNFPLDID
jgi:hypothetical protein